MDAHQIVDAGYLEPFAVELVAPEWFVDAICPMIDLLGDPRVCI